MTHIDRPYVDEDEDELLEAHAVLWKSLHYDGDKVNFAGQLRQHIKRDALNTLLEYERELAFRERERS